MKSSLLIVSLVFAFTSMSQAADIHVPADHKSIQAAIDAAKPGDTVLVSAGQYNEHITLRPRVYLRSAGDDSRGEQGLKRAEATIIHGGGKREGNAANHAGVRMAEGATIDGFTITGVGHYDDKSWQHHYKTQGNEQKHEHIGRFGAPAIAIRGVNCDVLNNIVHHNGDTGIAILGIKGKRCSPRVTANICYRNMGGGIGSMARSTAIIDSNTCYENFFAGIGHNDADPYVINNICYNNVRAGIGISEGACPVVRFNKCYKNRRAGIGTRTLARTKPIIEHNECYENAMAGIGTDENAQPIIRDNHCHHNALAGIGSQHGAKPLIVGNRTHQNKASGIGARDGASPIMIGNEVHQNGSAGIGLQTKSRAIAIDNQCINNTLVALGMPAGGDAIMVDNTFERAGNMPPLIAIRGNADALLYRNTIKGGGVASVLIQGNVTLLNNTFTADAKHQPVRAIWAWKGSTVRMVNNRLNHLKQAIKASGSHVIAEDNAINGFDSIAIDIDQPSKAPRIIGNAGNSKNPKARVVKSESGQIHDNTLQSKDAP